MAEVQIKNISHTHDMIMNWLIANPERALRECADHFRVTQSWLSVIIHSDVFRARLREKQIDVFSRVAADVPEKLAAVASMVTDQMMDMLERNTDKDYTLDAFDKIMHRAGYAPASARNPAGNPVQVNNFIVDRSTLEAARARMNQAGMNTSPVQDAEIVADAPEAPAQIPPPTPTPPLDILDIPAADVLYATASSAK